LSNRIDTKLNVTDTASLSNRIDIKLNGADTASLSNRINTKLNRSDTASLSNRIDTKLNRTDTVSLSNRINTKLNVTDTASLSNRIDIKLNGMDTVSLSNRINTKLNVTDTVLLSNRIDTKLNVTDTVLLSNRINTKSNITDTVLISNRINTKLNVTDTASLSNRIETKLNVTDTSSLSNRINTKLNGADTASLSNRINTKLNVTDTVLLSNQINTKLNITDTASLSNRINAKLNITDTVLLSNRINTKLNITDTVLLSNRIYTKLNITDTASLSNRINTKLNVTDTALLSNRINTKLNITDTVSLSNRINTKLNVTDTALLSNRINTKLNETDVATLLNPYFKKSDTTSLNLTNRFNAKVNVTDFPQGTATGNILIWDNGNWVNLAPGSSGQSLIISSSGIPTWGCIITNTAGTASSTPTLNAYSALTPITHSTSGATGIGTATGLPAGVSASWTANTITISGTPSSAGSFTYTIPLTGGCGSINATGSMTVNAVAATLTTTSIGSITATDASSGGNITVDGGASITARGVVWSTSTGPTVSLSTKTTDGTGTGTFTSTISGLTASTSYYMRAYATNAAGTSYGNEVTFSTCTLNTAGSPSSSPSHVVNTALTNITISTTGATGIGAATGLPAGVTASWSNNVITISGTPTSTGTFSYSIPLSGGCGSVNATGTITVTVFTCGTNTVSDIDGNPYNTVLIGNQCWTKENLRVRRYNDGTWIRFDNSGGSLGTTSQTWAGTGLNYGAHTIYANDSVASPSYLTTYGYLYNWYAAKGIATSGSTTYKNICPTGWHVPTDSDWNKLVKSIHSDADTTGSVDIQSASAGAKLKKNDALWASNTGTDDYGFSALPGGFRIGDIGNNSFSDVRDFALFWSSTEWTNCCGWIRYLNKDNSNFYRFNYIRTIYFYKSVGASVRCLKD